MGQVVASALVISVLVGIGVGRKVEKARNSHGYYRRVKGSVPRLRKAAVSDFAMAARVVLIVGIIVLFVAAVGFTGGLD